MFEVQKWLKSELDTCSHFLAPSPVTMKEDCDDLGGWFLTNEKAEGKCVLRSISVPAP